MKGPLQTLVEKAGKIFTEDLFKTAKLSADTGFCDEANLKYLCEDGIDAHIPDQSFRKQDERFKDAHKYYPKERKKKSDKFHLRGNLKVTDQWLAFCIVHSMDKIQRYGTIG